MPEENDEPKELAEFGRRPIGIDDFVSGTVTADIECRNFGAYRIKYNVIVVVSIGLVYILKTKLFVTHLSPTVTTLSNDRLSDFGSVEYLNKVYYRFPSKTFRLTAHHDFA